MDLASTTRERIDNHIFQARCAVEAVFEVAPEWASLSRDDKTDEHLEWDYARDAMNALEKQVAAGTLTEDQREAYAAMQSELRNALPTLDRLGFSKPPPQIVAS